jgi:hypothetical protein
MQIPPPYAEIAGKVGETKRRLDDATGLIRLGGPA